MGATSTRARRAARFFNLLKTPAQPLLVVGNERLLKELSGKVRADETQAIGQEGTRRCRRLSLALLGLFSIALGQRAGAAARRRAAASSKENATVKVADHVYAIPDGSVPMVPNTSASSSAAARRWSSTPDSDRATGEAILREVAKVSKNAEMYVATTHYHPEHSLGGAAFPATAKFVRPKMQQQDMDELGKDIQNTFASRSPLNQELLKDVPYPRADILFDREQRIDLGGVHVRLFWRGPMHTRGDTLIFVEEDRVLFSGDVVMNRTFLAAGRDVEYRDVAVHARRARRARSRSSSCRATAAIGDAIADREWTVTTSKRCRRASAS